MTHVDLGLAIDNAVLVAVGYAVLYALAIVDLRRGSILFVGLAYLVGWALIGVVLTGLPVSQPRGQVLQYRFHGFSFAADSE